MQRARAARVRTAALGTTVGLCLLIPLAAASADSAHDRGASADGPRASASGAATPKPSGGSHDYGNGVAPGGPDGIDAVKQLLGPASSPAATKSVPVVPAGTVAVADKLCGKAVETQGVRAQTCVEREGGEVWARVYYRNTSAEPLMLVLGMVRPGVGAGSLQMTCDIDAKSGDGQCDTPRLRTDQPLAAWSAVAEIATADGSRKVLRSGTAGAAG